jgi:signal transduction histidine kinase
VDARNPARGAMDRSIADVDHVLTVFGALLRIAQIQTRQRRAAFGKVELSQLVGGVVADYRPLFEDEGRSLSADIQPGIETVGDRPLLVQLLVNIIENVLRHTPPGVPVTVRLTRTADAARLSVEDAGPGIPSSQHERVLQRFVRLDASRSALGTGLGLALVKAISDLHEAPLRLEELQPGLRVTISLPLAR